MAIDSFIRYLQYEKRYAAHTITSYKTDLSQFTTYLNNTFDLQDLTLVRHQHVRSWLVELMEQQLSARSVNRKISTLKSLFKFMLRKGLVTKDPMLKVVAPKTPKRLPQFVEERDITNLLEAVEFGDDFPGARNKLIIEMLYATGMRLSELTGLRESDINKSSQQLKVFGKGSKERIIPFGPVLRDSIEQYISLKRKTFGREASENLLVTDKGKALYPKLVYRVVNESLSKVTTIDKKSPHILRHTFATLLLNQGADLNAIKELLGHASLAATQVYTHNTIDKLKDIHKQAHPKA